MLAVGAGNIVGVAATVGNLGIVHRFISTTCLCYLAVGFKTCTHGQSPFGGMPILFRFLKSVFHKTGFGIGLLFRVTRIVCTVLSEIMRGNSEQKGR